MNAGVFYHNELLEEEHYYTDFKRLLEDDPRPLVTAMVLEVDEAGTPIHIDKPLATWNGFLKKALTDAQCKQLMSCATENYTEVRKEEPAFVREGWANLWADYTPCILQ